MSPLALPEHSCRAQCGSPGSSISFFPGEVPAPVPPFAAYTPALIKILFAVAAGISNGQLSYNPESPSCFTDF